MTITEARVYSKFNSNENSKEWMRNNCSYWLSQGCKYMSGNGCNKDCKIYKKSLKDGKRKIITSEAAETERLHEENKRLKDTLEKCNELNQYAFQRLMECEKELANYQDAEKIERFQRI